MKLLLLALFGLALGQECPPMGDWREKSECLWLQNADGKLSPQPIREGFMSACGLSPSTDIPAPQLKHDINWPDKCGHCSFKLQCQNRPFSEGCFPIKIKKEVCSEHSDVCELPRDPSGNCLWGMMKGIMGQCITNRPDMAGWKRQGFIENAQAMPDMNCEKKDDKCHCCCHPFQPKDGACVEPRKAEPTCEAFGDWNDWTECLWHPMDAMMAKVKNHCKPKEEKKKGKEEKWEMPSDFLPEGFEPPPRCGFCSFKVKCRKRATGGKRGCFPVEADRISCGNDECEGCGEVCTLPHLPEPGQLENCDWQKYIINKLLPFGERKMAKIISYWRKHAMKKMVSAFMPLGSCKDVGDQCKCCCHPYEPNEDGTACVLKDICKIPSDRGIKLTVQE